LDETTDIELFMTIHTSKFLQMMGPSKRKRKKFTPRSVTCFLSLQLKKLAKIVTYMNKSHIENEGLVYETF
jgi:hypothetical protein